MEKIYRVGIIGSTGRGDYGHGVDVAFTKLPNVEVAAVADPHDGGRAAAQKRTAAPKSYGDYRSMLQEEKLDVVGLCPRWIDQHHDMLLASAEAGCHVYMEKPFCRTLTESDEVRAGHGDAAPETGHRARDAIFSGTGHRPVADPAR